MLGAAKHYSPVKINIDIRDFDILLSNYYAEHKKFPTPQNFPTIAHICVNLRWKRWGISSWEDLIQKTGELLN